MNRQPVLAILLALSTFSCGDQKSLSDLTARSEGHGLREEAQKVVSNAQKNLFSLQIEGKRWDMPSYLGMHYTSQYYLFLRWTDRIKESQLNVSRLKSELLKSQLPNGAWITVRDHLREKGDINASVVNYAALKAMGVSLSSPEMEKAREWILKSGGIEASSTFTKAFLALFGQHSWDVIPEVPLVIFNEKGAIYPGNIFAQWVAPHVFPLAYLRHHRVYKNLGSQFDLTELKTQKNNFKPQQVGKGNEPTADIKTHVERMLDQQRNRGSFGAYTLATLFSIMVLDDFRQSWPKSSTFISKDVEQKGIDFLESMYVNNATQTYQGVVNDGHLWDTVLIADALLTSGIDSKELKKTATYLASRQVANGGLPFGDDFEPNPDTDDTSIALSVWGHYPEHKVNVTQGIKFILSLQNDDGGIAAFSRNNVPIPLIDSLIGSLKDSADLFDESSADIVGHVMEGIGRSYAQTTDSRAIKKMLGYLEKSRDPEHKVWKARWGINYIYGTSAVVTGMHALGFKPDHEFMQDGLNFLAARQNSDGGFGETAHSDFSTKLAGRGPSSPTQTALALMALLADDDRYQNEIEKAVSYLIKEFNSKGKWEDPHAVGIGHPEIIYMEYPSYPYAFPLKALGAYLKQKHNLE